MIFFFAAIVPVVASASTIRVPADYVTIQGAIDAAVPGDTILVDSGTYNENVVVDKTLNLSGVDTGSGLPIVDGSGLNAINITADDVTLHGFNVTNATGDDQAAIYVIANNTSITNNIASNNSIGIYLDNSSNDTVTGNTANNNSNDGIYLYSSNYNNLTGNTANNNSNDGIYLYSSNNNNLTGNTANNNYYYYDDYDYGGVGICLYSSKNNNLTGNTANNNYYGVELDSSSNNNLTGNTANNNDDGIYIYNNSNNNIVTGNTANNNAAGIYLSYSSNYNTVTGNTANNNGDGIKLYISTNNNLNGNTANNNGVGIELSTNANDNNMTGNTVIDNSEYGIYIYFFSQDNNLTGNNFSNNGYGIYIFSAAHNLFWQNTIAGNTVNATVIDPTGGLFDFTNFWNSTTKLQYTYNGNTYTNYTGNYWGGYTGTDSNSDGIGDTAYTIGTKNVDYYPMLLTATATGPVKNLRTGLMYQTIQAAINDSATLAGDTITVDSGTYNENVAINKTLNLTGVDTGSGRPVVDGLNGASAINITANDALVQGFTATNATTGIDIRGINDTVKSNNASNNLYFGIYIEIDSMKNNVTGNVASNNKNGEGICILGLSGPSYNNVSGNTVCNNGGGFGGIVCGLCSNNTISNNVVNDNRLYGIYLRNSNNNTLAGNAVNNNSYAGIFLDYTSSNNTLAGNTVSLNGNDYNSHTGGIILKSGSNYNYLTANNASYNYYNGIYLQNDEVGNVLWLNIFSGNYQNASGDYVAGSVNAWNSTAPLSYTYNSVSHTNYTGNYWGNYEGPDTNGDGIGDDPYYVNGLNIDRYPMLLTAPAAPGPVKNLRTGLTYATIQAAISDANTVDSDTILVSSGTYLENVVVNKSLNLTGVDTGSGLPVVDASGSGAAISITVDDTTVRGFNTTNGMHGIEVRSMNNTITGNIVCYNSLHGIIVVNGNNTVTGNLAFNDTNDGIYVTGSGCTVESNTVWYNWAGMYTYNLKNSIIRSNIAHDNDVGIYLTISSFCNVTVALNNASNNVYGIMLNQVNGSNVIGNALNNNSNYGIIVSYSRGSNNITSNTAMNNTAEGFFIHYSWGCNLTSNSGRNNRNGIGLYYSNFNNLTGNTMDDNTLNGISLSYSSYNNLTGNTVLNNTDNGIHLLSSGNCNLTSNVARNNTGGIYLNATSRFNNVTANVACNNTDTGIRLSSSSNNTIRGNTADNNSGWGGIDLYNSIGCDIAGNSFCNGVRGILLGVSPYNNVTGNTACNNTEGIYILYSSNYNNVTDNRFNNNSWYGIEFYGSDFNNLTGNEVRNNKISGCKVDSSSGNVFWLNVIAGNGVNANAGTGSVNGWNSTTPLVYTYGGVSFTNYTGNYWGDYGGPDANVDGIGDTPYVVNSTNIDHYPMLLAAATQTYTLHLKQGWNLVSFPVVNTTLKASDLAGTGILIVASYNRSTGDYDAFNTASSPLTYDITLRTDVGYFVYCTRDTSIVVTGANPDNRNATLYQGWNLIGWSALTGNNAKSVCDEIPLTGQQIIARFNATTGDFDAYAEGISPDAYDFMMMDGVGYFVYTGSATPQTLYYDRA